MSGAEKGKAGCWKTALVNGNGAARGQLLLQVTNGSQGFSPVKKDIGGIEKEDFLLLLMELKRAGKTMVFSTHRLEEVTALADRVLLLESGRLVVDSPPHELEQRLGWQTTLHLYLSEQGIDPALQALTAHGLPVSRNGRGVRVQVAPGRNDAANASARCYAFEKFGNDLCLI